MARIRGHVDYGKGRGAPSAWPVNARPLPSIVPGSVAVGSIGSEPIEPIDTGPPRSGFVASAAQKREKRLTSERGPGRPAKPLDEQVYAVVLAAARYQDRCPTAPELQRLVGSTANTALLRLAATGRVVIEVYGKNWRVVRIGKLNTALPPGGRKPYRMIDQHGSFWRGPHGWERR